MALAYGELHCVCSMGKIMTSAVDPEAMRAALRERGFMVVVHEEPDRVIGRAYSERGWAYDRFTQGATDAEALSNLLELVDKDESSSGVAGCSCEQKLGS